MVVSARQAALTIVETADLQDYSRASITYVYRELSPKKKEEDSSERQFSRREILVDERGWKTERKAAAAVH